MSLIADLNFVAIDFETANWHKTSVCSVAAVTYEKGEVVNEYHTLVQPIPYLFSHHNTKVHGIRMDDVTTAPSLDEVWPALKSRLKGRIAVAHNASFDRSIVHALEAYYKEDCEIVDWLCTLYQSRVYLPQLENHQLPTVYKHLFDIEVEHHNAFWDAAAAGKIALELAKLNEVPTFNGMVCSLPDEARDVRMARKTPPLVSIVKDIGYEFCDQLKGREFCFTGEMAKFRKEDAWQIVVNFGGRINNGANKSTTDLVVGKDALSSPTSKLKKTMEAIEAGQETNILTEEDFYNLIEQLDGNTLYL